MQPIMIGTITAFLRLKQIMNNRTCWPQCFVVISKTKSLQGCNLVLSLQYLNRLALAKLPGRARC